MLLPIYSQQYRLHTRKNHMCVTCNDTCTREIEVVIAFSTFIHPFTSCKWNSSYSRANSSYETFFHRIGWTTTSLARIALLRQLREHKLLCCDMALKRNLLGLWGAGWDPQLIHVSVGPRQQRRPLYRFSLRAHPPSSFSPAMKHDNAGELRFRQA